MKRILILDPDHQARDAMAELFLSRGYEALREENGMSALERMSEIEVDLVITDIGIKPMGGYELLETIKERHPSVIRIIMSSRREESLVIGAIMKNLARFYILKPWDKGKLLDSVSQAFDTDDALKSDDLKMLIGSIDKLPTIDTNYQKILNMIEKDIHIGAIGVEIEKDFAISSKLLQIANSAYYGLRTGSVRHATVYLGMQNLKSLIYSTAILNSFDSVSDQDQQRVRDLWAHALLTSKLLHYIYETFLHRKLPEIAYSAGLLHNIGTLILIQNRIEDYGKLMDHARKNSQDILSTEQEAFRATHQEAGGYLVSLWKLPYPIIEAALYHHKPLDSNVMNKEIVAAVHLAQHYAWMLTKQPAVTEFYKETFKILDIPVSSFEAAVKWKNWM